MIWITDGLYLTYEEALNNANIVFNFPMGKYNTSKNINHFTFKAINDMVAEGSFDI